MSQDVPSKTKEKKAQRDAERQQKRLAKKRKHDETVEPEEDGVKKAELQEDFIPLGVDASASGEGALAVKAPKLKKRKQKEEASAEAEGVNVPVEGAVSKSKKRKQKDGDAAEQGSVDTALDAARMKSKKRKQKDDAAEAEAVVTALDESTPKPKKRKKAAQETVDGAKEVAEVPKALAKTDKTEDRFIVFVGNLPYNTTDASLQTHFNSIMPFNLRHRTDPKTGKSKGFAFLEFENYDRMGTCLKTYHHSMFDAEAGRKGGKGARRINVELTAGGGGAKGVRMEKIKEKNVRLDGQRQRRAEQEVKEKARADRKGGATKKTPALKEKPEPESKAEAENTGMHPSRLARLTG